MTKLDEKALAVAKSRFNETRNADGPHRALEQAIAAYLAALPPEQSAAQQPATDAVDHGQPPAERAAIAYWNDDALWTGSQSPAKPAGDA